jgi:hypothetical protein
MYLTLEIAYVHVRWSDLGSASGDWTDFILIEFESGVTAITVVACASL